MNGKSWSKSDLKLRLLIKQAIKEALANLSATQPKSLLNDEGATKFLNLAKGTLPVWRHHGKGPKFIKIGTAVRYRIQDLEEYINSNTVNPY